MGQNQSERRGRQAAKKASPPQVHLLYGRDNQCRKRSNAGAPGAKPPAKLTYSLPLPTGKGGRGMGAESKRKAELADAMKASPHRG